jgi:hypothetical protein
MNSLIYDLFSLDSFGTWVHTKALVPQTITLGNSEKGMVHFARQNNLSLELQCCRGCEAVI